MDSNSKMEWVQPTVFASDEILTSIDNFAAIDRRVSLSDVAFHAPEDLDFFPKGEEWLNFERKSLKQESRSREMRSASDLCLLEDEPLVSKCDLLDQKAAEGRSEAPDQDAKQVALACKNPPIELQPPQSFSPVSLKPLIFSTYSVRKGLVQPRTSQVKPSTRHVNSKSMASPLEATSEAYSKAFNPQGHRKKDSLLAKPLRQSQVLNKKNVNPSKNLQEVSRSKNISLFNHSPREVLNLSIHSKKENKLAAKPSSSINSSTFRRMRQNEKPTLYQARASGKYFGGSTPKEAYSFEVQEQISKIFTQLATLTSEITSLKEEIARGDDAKLTVRRKGSNLSEDADFLPSKSGRFGLNKENSNILN